MRRRGLVWVGACALLLTGCGGGSSSAPAVAPAPQVMAGHFRCPDPEAAPERVTDPGSDSLPTGADAARLCLRDNHVAWIPPQDTLTTRLDGLVEAVNAQRVHDPHSAIGCGGVGAPAWSIVLRYDGGTRTITGDNGGCWDLRVGSTERFGSRHVYDAYLRALLAQRHQQGAPDALLDPPPCPDHLRTDDSFSPVADASHLSAARVCSTDGGPDVRATALSPAQVLALRNDIATASPRRRVRDLAGPCLQQRRQLEAAVVGVDAWGDPVTLLIECDAYRTVQPGSDRYLFARMLPSTERMLESALTG